MEGDTQKMIQKADFQELQSLEVKVINALKRIEREAKITKKRYDSMMSQRDNQSALRGNSPEGSVGSDKEK